MKSEKHGDWLIECDWYIFCLNLFCLYIVERLMLYLDEFLWVCDFHFKHTVFPGWSSRRLCSSVFSSKEITALPHSRCWMVSYFEVDTWARLQDGTGGFFMDQSWIFWYKKMAICLRTWTFGRCGERHGMFHCCVTMLLWRIVRHDHVSGIFGSDSYKGQVVFRGPFPRWLTRHERAGEMNGAIVALVMWLWTCDLTFLGSESESTASLISPTRTTDTNKFHHWNGHLKTEHFLCY